MINFFVTNLLQHSCLALLYYTIATSNSPQNYTVYLPNFKNSFTTNMGTINTPKVRKYGIDRFKQ